MGTDARGDSLSAVNVNGKQLIKALTTAAHTIDQSDQGKLLTANYAGTTTITVPAPSLDWVGFWCYIANAVAQSLVIAGATADCNYFIADNVLTSDTVSLAGEGGGMVRLACVSATKWMVVDMSVGVAMTVEGAD